MSHFTVLVVGGNVAAQLAPYHEFECTGEDNEFVQDVDVTAECLAHADDDDKFGLGWYGLDDKQVSDENEVDRSGPHKYGFAVVKDGVLVKAVNRTNPNRHWDWWQVGGRWSGFFTLKPGATGEIGEPGVLGARRNTGPGYADQARKGDIDIEAMRNKAGEDAAREYDRMTEGVTDPWVSWAETRKLHEGNLDAAREAYNSQPAVVALQANRAKHDLYPLYKYDKLLVGREAFIQQARDGAIVTFAVVKDGQWYQRGDMGWWGCVSDEKQADDWHAEFSKLLDGLPDDTELTVVDCHI